MAAVGADRSGRCTSVTTPAPPSSRRPERGRTATDGPRGLEVETAVDLEAFGEVERERLDAPVLEPVELDAIGIAVVVVVDPQAQVGPGAIGRGQLTVAVAARARRDRDRRARAIPPAATGPSGVARRRPTQLVGLHRVVLIGVEPEEALALLFGGPLHAARADRRRRRRREPDSDGRRGAGRRPRDRPPGRPSARCSRRRARARRTPARARPAAAPARLDRIRLPPVDRRDSGASAPERIDSFRGFVQWVFHPPAQASPTATTCRHPCVL